MIDFNQLESYKENNRIEAKKALGGLPHSIWETYSAFANALGGIILLGVEEYKDKSLHAVDLPDPEGLVKEFWEMVNDPKIASVNILSTRNVTIENVSGNHIVVIDVPRADRTYKPVYVEGNRLNCYRRNGEGDYKCTPEEICAMERDASVRTQDMLILEAMDTDVFNPESVRAYRERMRLARPDHVWDSLDDEEFLLKTAAIGIGRDGRKHPTAAGLLMFGNAYDIERQYPQYVLDYREELGDDRDWTNRFISSSGDWSGNIFDFYTEVYYRILTDLKDLSGMGDGSLADETQVYDAISEGIANCLINADYYGRKGVVIIKKPNKIIISNPGTFRVDVAAARGGGISDARNGAIQKMSNLIDVGGHGGDGIAEIYRVWREHGWTEPVIEQSFNPDRVTLSLIFEDAPDKKPAKKTVGQQIIELQKNTLIQYLTEHITATASEIAEYFTVSEAYVREILEKLIDEDIVVNEGEGKDQIYRLKER